MPRVHPQCQTTPHGGERSHWEKPFYKEKLKIDVKINKFPLVNCCEDKWTMVCVCVWGGLLSRGCKTRCRFKGRETKVANCRVLKLVKGPSKKTQV